MSCILCENEFCIYEENGKCTLDEITLNIDGSCNECIYINIDKQTLKMLKSSSIK